MASLSTLAVMTLRNAVGLINGVINLSPDDFDNEENMAGYEQNQLRAAAELLGEKAGFDLVNLPPVVLDSWKEYGARKNLTFDRWSMTDQGQLVAVCVGVDALHGYSWTHNRPYWFSL